MQPEAHAATSRAAVPVTALSARSEADLAGSFEMGEGGEVVVTRGVIVREIAPEKEGELPKIAVGTAQGVHHLYDPNVFAMQGVWSGTFGRVDASGRFSVDSARLRSFSLRARPWAFGEKPRRNL